MSLAGRRILVTRTAEAWRRLEQTLEAAGSRPSFRPTTMQREPVDPGPAQRAMARVETYHWLAFGSGNGVRFFVDRLVARGLEPSRLRAGIVVVGEATGRAAHAAGLRGIRVAPEGTSEGLARLLSEIVGPGQRLLIVRPETESSLSPADLEGVPGEIDVAPFYRTEPASDIVAIAADLARGAYEAVLFTAPSSLRALVGVPGAAAALEKVKRVAIGPTTARALEVAALPADAIATTPTAEGATAALESLW